jgi:hypothetical protein
MFIEKPRPLAASWTAKDHTAIVRCTMDFPDPLLSAIGTSAPALRRQALSPSAALQALIAVDGIDEAMKEQAREVLRLLPLIEADKQKIPPTVRAAMQQVLDEVLRQPTVPAMLMTLRRLLASRQYAALPALATAIQVGIDVLEDGLPTIYSPDDLFYKRARSTAAPRLFEADVEIEASTGVAKADLEGVVEGAVGGALGGAVTGAFIGGVGAAPGAVTGAVAGGLGGAAATSVTKVVSNLLDWWFSDQKDDDQGDGE